MTSIIYVGMDVHTTNYTLCCYSIETNETFAQVQIEPDYKGILKYLNQVQSQRGGDCKFICGYEAGGLGYSLYHHLTYHGIECVILAPSTMAVIPGKRIKTDSRDAEHISKCLAYHTYSPVHIPSEEDDAVKEYIRMRDDAVTTLKRIKQQTIAFCARHGKLYDGKSYWTKRHLDWLEALDFGNAILQEAFQEYLIQYYQASERVDMYNIRIEELAQQDTYRERVQKLRCFNGIALHTALSLLVEVGDFKRFKTAQHFASYLGLVPGEHSSGGKQVHTGITKAGNTHLRRLLVESAQVFSRGPIGKKSAKLKAKQEGNPSAIIAYADKANERLKRKYHKIASHSKYNIAKTAVARELACFVWGMMTDNIA